MNCKALLLLFVTSAILAQADPMTEYFEGTVQSATQAGSGAPAFYNVPVGSPMVGSFSFDPSLGTADPSAHETNGLPNVTYFAPVAFTMQDTSGSFTATDIAAMYSNLFLIQGDWLFGGNDVASIGFQTSDEGAGVSLNLPAGSEGDLSLAEFPWGVQPTPTCDTASNVNTCSYAGAQTIIDGRMSDVVFFVDAVSLTPLSLAPEPSSMPIFALGLLGVVVGLASRQRRSNVA